MANYRQVSEVYTQLHVDEKLCSQNYQNVLNFVLKVYFNALQTALIAHDVAAFKIDQMPGAKRTKIGGFL